MSRVLVLSALLTLAAVNGTASAQGALPSVGNAQPAPPPSPTDSLDASMGFSKGFLNSMKDELANLKAAKRLPVRGLVLVETKDGRTFLLSEDGRLAIMGGKWVDLWERKQITSAQDAAVLDRIRFNKLGINPEEIASIRIGQGARKVTVFADPTDPLTKDLVRQIRALTSEFTFNVVLVPRRPGEAKEVIAKLVCASDRASAQQAFMTGSFTALPAPHSACDYTTVAKGMTTAVAIRIPGLPLVVRDDGVTAFGASISLASTLTGESRQ